MYKRISIFSAIVILSFAQAQAENPIFTASAPGLQETRGIAETYLSMLIPYIAYIELVLLLILLMYVVVTARQNSKKISKISSDLERLRVERKNLRAENESLSRELRKANSLVEEGNSELDRLKDKMEETTSNESVEKEGQSNTVEWDKPEVPKIVQETFYSRYADLADGFSAGELLEKESNDTIFEITIQSPNKATFKVNTNPAAQKYALSNADYFLKPTCHYDALPSGIIITELPGVLSLVGRKWQIIEKARISFK